MTITPEEYKAVVARKEQDRFNTIMSTTKEGIAEALKNGDAVVRIKYRNLDGRHLYSGEIRKIKNQMDKEFPGFTFKRETLTYSGEYCILTFDICIKREETTKVVESKPLPIEVTKDKRLPIRIKKKEPAKRVVNVTFILMALIIGSIISGALMCR